MSSVHDEEREPLVGVLVLVGLMVGMWQVVGIVLMVGIGGMVGIAGMAGIEGMVGMEMWWQSKATEKVAEMRTVVVVLVVGVVVAV